MEETAVAADVILPVEQLLPLQAAVVTLRFVQPCRLRFFHQAALYAFLKHLSHENEDFDKLLRIDTPEAGRVHYQRGDFYRFTLVGLSGSRALLDEIFTRLRGLPASASKCDVQIPFRDNLRLYSLQDAFSESSIESAGELTEYGIDNLDSAVASWRGGTRLRWRWVSPVRLLKDKARRKHLKGEARYCRDCADSDGALLLNRLHDTLCDLLRRRGLTGLPARAEPPAVKIDACHLFWMDSEYRDAKGKDHVMGGMAGRLTLIETS